MTREEALDKLCHSYSGYFDVVRHEEPKGYLVAEAGLHIHSEKYVLVKAAKLWEADNNEYVYIFSAPVLTKEIFEQCREQARADGMQRIEPGPPRWRRSGDPSKQGPLQGSSPCRLPAREPASSGTGRCPTVWTAIRRRTHSPGRE